MQEADIREGGGGREITLTNLVTDNYQCFLERQEAQTGMESGWGYGHS